MARLQGDLNFKPVKVAYNPLPIQEMQQTLGVLQNRYDTNLQNKSKIEAAIQNEKFLDDANVLKTEVASNFNNTLKSIIDQGNYEDADFLITEATKDYLSNQDVILARENYKRRQEDIARLQELRDKGEVVVDFNNQFQSFDDAGKQNRYSSDYIIQDKTILPTMEAMFNDMPSLSSETITGNINRDLVLSKTTATGIGTQRIREYLDEAYNRYRQTKQYSNHLEWLKRTKNIDDNTANEIIRGELLDTGLERAGLSYTTEYIENDPLVAKINSGDGGGFIDPLQTQYEVQSVVVDIPDYAEVNSKIENSQSNISKIDSEIEALQQGSIIANAGRIRELQNAKERELITLNNYVQVKQKIDTELYDGITNLTPGILGGLESVGQAVDDLLIGELSTDNLTFTLGSKLDLIINNSYIGRQNANNDNVKNDIKNKIIDQVILKDINTLKAQRENAQTEDQRFILDAAIQAHQFADIDAARQEIYEKYRRNINYERIKGSKGGSVKGVELPLTENHEETLKKQARNIANFKIINPKTGEEFVYNDTNIETVLSEFDQVIPGWGNDVTLKRVSGKEEYSFTNYSNNGELGFEMTIFGLKPDTDENDNPVSMGSLIVVPMGDGQSQYRKTLQKVINLSPDQQNKTKNNAILNYTPIFQGANLQLIDQGVFSLNGTAIGDIAVNDGDKYYVKITTNKLGNKSDGTPITQKYMTIIDSNNEMVINPVAFSGKEIDAAITLQMLEETVRSISTN